MGYVEPPLALTEKEFDTRIRYLKEVGLPLTMKNIDPAFYKHCQIAYYKFLLIVSTAIFGLIYCGLILWNL